MTESLLLDRLGGTLSIASRLSALRPWQLSALRMLILPVGPRNGGMHMCVSTQSTRRCMGLEERVWGRQVRGIDRC